MLFKNLDLRVAKAKKLDPDTSELVERWHVEQKVDNFPRWTPLHLSIDKMTVPTTPAEIPTAFETEQQAKWARLNVLKVLMEQFEQSLDISKYKK
jgi:hypothetical protein